MRYTIGLLTLFILSACTHVREQQVVFHLNGAFNRHFVLERVGFNEGKPQIVDSGVARSNRDSFVFTLPVSEPAVYFILPQNKGYRIPFVYDSTGLRIIYNYGKDEYHFENSPASEEWRRFQQGQEAINGERQRIEGRPGGGTPLVIDSLPRAAAARNFHFADTTTNPALFLLAFNQVDFDTDYQGLEKFIKRAGQRFPANTAVQTLVRNTLDFVAIFSTRLRIGDQLPSLQLPDSTGQVQLVGPAKDKYLLIDCWSSWCDACRVFSMSEKAAWQHADTGKFVIISIAVDAEKQAWMNILRFEHYPWQQLIDEKMWTGPAARALHFDSLPYNFFVAPGGRLLSKAIPADSLLPILSSHGLIRKNN
jgi:hypothetical protein